MSDLDSILVIGGAGQQGAAVLRAARRRSLPAQALVRRESDVAAAKANGAESAIVADLGDPGALARAAETARAVFLVTPFEANRDQALATAERVVKGLALAGARHVVFNTGLIASMSAVGVGSVDGKLATLAALRAAGVPVVELAVTYYLENWLMPWASGGVRAGRLGYPLPGDMAVSWLALDDMGEAAFAALTRPDLAGATVQLGGVSCTPAQMTESIARAVGKPLVFEQIAIDDFVAGGDAASGPAQIGTAIGALYRWTLAQQGAAADVGAAGLRALGVDPTPPAEWIVRQRWN